MPKLSLTIPTLKALRPEPGRQIDYHDTTLTGFAVRVSPAGKKTFCIFYRRGRLSRRYTIGSFPNISLADARGEAKRALRDAAMGKDPAEEKKKSRNAETFSELADLYLEKHASKKKTGAEDRRIVDRYLLPELKRVRAQDVTRRQIRKILEAVEKTGPVMANRVLSCVKTIYNWGLAHDVVEGSPCVGLARPTVERSRDRVYSEEELKKVWNAAEAEASVVGALFQLQLLTATRVSEASNMKWSEIEERWWTIPAQRSKNGLSHRV